MFITFWLLVCWIALGTVAVGAEVDAGFPAIGSIGLHATRAADKHPCVFYRREDIDAARRRRRDARYKEAVKNLDELANEASKITLEPLDRTWWDQVKSKPWRDTYPIIYEKTSRQPGRLARPAYYAALRAAVRHSKADVKAAKRILLHLSTYTFEYEHYDVGMNYAGWGILVLHAYDLLRDEFAEEERVVMDKFFTRMARAVLKNDIYWIKNDIGGGLNNHLAWHKMILGTLGLFYRRDDLVEYALRGPRGMQSLLDDGLVDDGLWRESSLTYHFTAIVPMVYLAEAMAHSGYATNLYTLETPAGRSLRQAFDSMFGVLFPDGTIPPIGDTYGIRRKLSDEFCYYYAYRQYRDPRYAWLLRQAPRTRPELLFVGLADGAVEIPRAGTRLYREHGLALLRQHRDASYWTKPGWCAFLNFGRSDVHHHQDRLSLMVFGAGKLLEPDVESRATVPHAFSARVQRELNRTALSQNTVMVDYRSQRSIRKGLQVVQLRDAPDEKRVCVADPNGSLYAGVRQMRCIVVRPHYVLDVFQLESDQEHDYSWITHGAGRLESLRASVLLAPSTDGVRGPGGAWLRDVRRCETDSDVSVDCSVAEVKYRITIGGGPATEVIACGYPVNDQTDAALLPMLVIHRRAANATYVVVHQAGQADLRSIRVGQSRVDADQIVCSVECDGVKHEFRIPRLPTCSTDGGRQ